MTKHGASPDGDRAGGPSDLSRSASQPKALIPSAGFDWYRLLPLYWLQNEPTDRYWDAALNVALDHFEPIAGYCVAQIGPFEVWTANWPYAYGKNYGDHQDRLPMVHTRLRLRRLLQQGRCGDLGKRLESAINANSSPAHGDSL